jgi:hypothetical protein
VRNDLTNDDPAVDRELAYSWLNALRTGPDVPREWRTVVTDTESLSGFGPVCPDRDAHPLLDMDMGRDTTGVYDCCPHVVETFSTALAAFLVALLNRDALRNPEPGHCGRKGHHVAHDWHDAGISTYCTGRDLR